MIEIKLYDQEKLKPCPFCGHKTPEVVFSELETVDEDPYLRFVRIECPKCGIRMADVMQFIKLDRTTGMIAVEELTDLIKAWNTRGGVSDGPD